MTGTVYVALAEAYPDELSARVSFVEIDGIDPGPYRGVWVHPTPEAPLVHVFSQLDDQALTEHGWRRP